MLDRIASHQLLVVTGKGGVGKTAISVTLGRCLAAAGRRVLVLEVDPRENAHQMLGIAPSGGEMVPAGARLWLQNLTPRSVLDQVVRRQLRLDLLAGRVLSSPVYHHFVEGAPGIKEMAVLGHAMSCVRGLEKGVPQLDVVVLDAPASGHGVSLLSAPALVAEVIGHGPIGRMAGELAAFVSEVGRCGAVVASTAEEMPVQEAVELLDRLEAEQGRKPALVVLNALYPPLPEDRHDVPPDPFLEVWRQRRRVNDRERRRLLERWRGTTLELPLLPIDRGPELIEALQRAVGEERRWI